VCHASVRKALSRLGVPGPRAARVQKRGGGGGHAPGCQRATRKKRARSCDCPPAYFDASGSPHLAMERPTSSIDRWTPRSHPPPAVADDSPDHIAGRGRTQRVEAGTSSSIGRLAGPHCFLLPFQTSNSCSLIPSPPKVVVILLFDVIVDRPSKLLCAWIKMPTGNLMGRQVVAR